MNKFKKFIFETDKAIIFTMFALLVIDREIFLATFNYCNALVIKLFVLFQIYVFIDEVMRFLVYLWNSIPKIEFDIPKKATYSMQNTIDWIDCELLVWYIFESKKLWYEDMRNKFWITPQKYKILWDNLESAWIVKRGKNNARILKEWLDKFEVLKHLSQFEKSDSITPLLHRYWNSAEVV